MQRNILLQQEIDATRQQTEEAQRELEALRATLNQQFLKQQQIQRRLAPEILADKLTQASSDSDVQSDALADAFLSDSDVQLKDFMTQFLALRKQYHLRLIKREALLASRGAVSSGSPAVIASSSSSGHGF